MTFDPEKHHRRSIRWKCADYTAEGRYFITICTHAGRCVLGSVEGPDTVLSDVGRVVQECWLDLPERMSFVELGAHVLMPNHLHGIIIIVRSAADNRPAPATHCPAGSVGAIIRSFKAESTRRVRERRGDPNFHLWQRNYYEHIVRGYKSLAAISRYIRENPVHWHRDLENPDAAR